MRNRIAYINLGNYGSTGKIVDGLSKLAKDCGDTVLRCYPGNILNNSKKENDYVICSYTAKRINHRLSIHTGLPGCFSLISTYRLIQELKRFDADVIHLHNLHGDYVNLKILFRYLKETDSKIIWTLHDCWAFTGRCPYFQISGCGKWKDGCRECPYPKNDYPESFLDFSKMMWKMKKRLFTGIDNMVLVTPSNWLRETAKSSFLGKQEIRTIYNGISLDVFRPTESDLRNRYGMHDRFYIVLGAAFNWNERKGLDVFISLSEALDDCYRIVLVGTDNEVDKKLPEKIISIHRTMNQKELAGIYTAADVFVNPTREEALGLTNIEALACGTPVITFNSGGSPECVDKETGIVIDKNGKFVLNELVKSIEKICTGEDRSKKCRDRAAMFDENITYKEYMKLYHE